MDDERDRPTDEPSGSAPVLQMHPGPNHEGDHPATWPSSEREQEGEGAGAPEAPAADRPVEEAPAGPESEAGPTDRRAGPEVSWKPSARTGPGAEAERAEAEALGPHYAPLLAALEEECRRIIRVAEADAGEVRHSAEEYRASVVAEAHRASEALLAAAGRERDSILQAAAAEITRWLDEFEAECRRWTTQARQSAPGTSGPGPGADPDLPGPETATPNR